MGGGKGDRFPDHPETQLTYPQNWTKTLGCWAFQLSIFLRSKLRHRKKQLFRTLFRIPRVSLLLEKQPLKGSIFPGVTERRGNVELS